MRYSFADWGQVTASTWRVAKVLHSRSIELTPNDLSEELRVFLKGRMSSVDQVDIVLLLLANSDRSWTAPEVARSLTMAPESTAMRLFLLASAGLITFEASGVPRYRYTAADETADRLLRELAAVYPANRAEVLDALQGPAEIDPIRSFADAFKWKK